MTKLVDIERMKNKYYHSIGTQFDNAIFVAEKEFLVDAYTNADIIDIFDKIRTEIEEHVKLNQCLNVDRARALCWCLDVIDKYSVVGKETMEETNKQNPNEICWKEDRKTRYSNCNYCKHKDECERNPYGLMSTITNDEDV